MVYNVCYPKRDKRKGKVERRVANRSRVRSSQLYSGIWQLRISTGNPSAPLFHTVGAIEGRVAEWSENIYMHTGVRRKGELPFFAHPCLDVRVQNYHRAPLLSPRSSAHTPRQTGDGLCIQQLGIAWIVSTHVWGLAENSYLLLSFSFFFVLYVYFVTRNTQIANVLSAISKNWNLHRNFFRLQSVTASALFRISRILLRVTTHFVVHFWKV